MVISIPIAPKVFFSSDKWTIVSLLAYLLFYSFLFYSVMVQITQKKEVSESVIYGSLSGFLLLLVLATFSFLLLDLSIMDSFLHISGDSIPSKYQQFSYYSLITLTTIGYGDITPVSEQARLLAGFWGVVSQFYMVAIVGIIISKYTSK
ncbi:potassium channel family protein [Shivajiella indica]|uniref:Potassium channel family protein n=1 Tax=Shivajiella indica TaxID=872115 RepID=A0ABW5B4A9_9BACT